MGLRTPEEYVEGLKNRRNVEIYAFGELVDDVAEHPFLKPTVRSMLATFELAFSSEHRDLARAWSPFIESEVNRFNHIHESVEDLVKKVKLLRVLSRRVGSCFQRCVGWDALNTASIITYRIDGRHGTSYYERFIRYLKYVQERDLVVAGAMTDVKGDRRLRPSEQVDPDLYVHVAEKREDGVVVRGAKANITGVAASDEIFVMPTRAMSERDRDYALVFAIPVDTEGVKLIVGRQVNDTRRLEGEIDGLPYHAAHECLVVFDDVFVPWSRVFMCGEWEFAGSFVETFASYHRYGYGGCKAGLIDVAIGASYALAEYTGVAEASHVRDKITEMILLAESMYAAGLAAAYEGSKQESGTYWVNPVYANVTKQLVTRYPYEVARLTHDIAGGIIGTLPSERDWRSPKLRPVLEKYLKCTGEKPVEYRIRMLRLLENMTSSTSFLIESMHGAGSPEAQRIMLRRQYSLEESRKTAEKLAGLSA